ncbi:MAG: TetR/AcrR family transcriptional regulator [Bacteroidales bacterium]|nr:TetR/AcrR family transcriptional regulator [Bacteroidales bacterium]
MKYRSKKYRAIIETARSLFWKYGFKKVTVEEVCEKAGVSKMTFYRYFSNKTDLAKSVYEQVVNEGMQKFRKIIHDENTGALEKMEQILLLKSEGTHEISKEFLDDFYNNPELGLSGFIEEKSREAWSEIVKDFRLAQKKGWFRKDFKPEGMLLMVNKLSEIIKEPQMLHLYGNPQDLIMELARFFTYGIMQVKDH